VSADGYLAAAAHWWSLFTCLSSEHAAIQALSRASQMRQLDNGAALVKEGDEDDAVFIVASGGLKTVRHTDNGHEVWYSDVRPGDVIGEITALTGAARTSSIIARQATSVFAVDRQTFLQIATAYPEFALAIARLLARRLQMTSQRMADLVALSVANRLHSELARIGEPSATDREAFLIESPPTVSALGQRIHATREATSRALKELEDRGLVERIPRGWMVVVPGGAL
jgi:CRP-like cAMP-binding protein